MSWLALHLQAWDRPEAESKLTSLNDALATATAEVEALRAEGDALRAGADNAGAIASETAAEASVSCSAATALQ